MAKRKGKGKSKKTTKETVGKTNPPQNVDKDQLQAGNDGNSKEPSTAVPSHDTEASTSSSLKRKQSTLSRPSTSGQGKDSPPPVKRMRSTQSVMKESTENSHRQNSIRPSRLNAMELDGSSTGEQSENVNVKKGAARQENKPSTSAEGATQAPSLKRNDTLIIEPSTSGAADSVPKLISVRTATGHSIATPMQLMKIASLRKDPSHAHITQPTSSDPETKALIAESMEKMRQASLKRTYSDSEESNEAREETQTETPTKKRTLSKTSFVKTISNNEASALSEEISESSNRPGTSTSFSANQQQAVQSNDKDLSNGASIQHSVSGTGNTANTDDKFEDDFNIICDVHPDCDPVYIREQLQLVIDDPQRVSTVTFDLFSKSDLPTRADREELEAQERRYRELENLPFDLERFVEKFPNAEETFEGGETVRKNKLYIENASVYLRNVFPAMSAAHINSVLRENSNYLTNTYDSLKVQYDEYTAKKRRNKKRFLLLPRENQLEYPDLDEDFCWERLYIQHRQEILDKVNVIMEAKEKRIQEARREGKLKECGVCFTPDLHEDDMLSCPDGHLFCKECVQMSSEEQIGRGKAVISCLGSDCSENFQFYHLEKILPTSQSFRLLQRMQTDELRRAEIENLVSCPHCPFSVIVPEEYVNEVGILRCKGPGCEKKTCIKCKRQSHIPYSCEEFETEIKAKFKDFAEQKLSGAIIRQCPKCNLRFFKEEGCNYMTCSSCNTSICYVCREEIRGYDHFRKSKLCAQYVNPKLFHEAELMQAFKSLQEGFKKEHPQFGAAEVPEMYEPDGLTQFQNLHPELNPNL